jgi:hypothetical protein
MDLPPQVFVAAGVVANAVKAGVGVVRSQTLRAIVGG